MPKISAILTAHHEGLLVGATLHSLIEASEQIEREGISVERVVILDRPDEATTAMFANISGLNLRMHEVDCGDQGKTRNAGIEIARGEFVAFLDGDDLWSFNWLSEAYRLASQSTQDMVVHPEFNWFFGGQQTILRHLDQDEPGFDPELMRTANYWDALCFARRSIHLRFPYCDRDIKGGFALEDHHWNCVTLEAGIRHKIAPNTVHFKRRRPGSQFAETTQTGAIRRPTALSYYDWYQRREPDSADPRD